MNPWMLLGVLFATAIGALLPLQALVNARLGAATQGAVFASFASFLVGTLALGLVLAMTRTPFPDASQAAGVPAWGWAGGIIGAIYVLSATLLVPRIGAAALICLTVFGQIVGSLLLDHYGVLNVARPLDASRLLGALLVGVGVLMVVRPWQSS